MTTELLQADKEYRNWLCYDLNIHTIKRSMLIIFTQIVCNRIAPNMCEDESGFQEKVSTEEFYTIQEQNQSSLLWDSYTSAVCFSGI